MPRIPGKLLLLFSALVLHGCAATTSSNVRTFPDGCPPGWRFLYTDHDVSRVSDRPQAVCRLAEADSVARAIAR